MEIKDHSSEMQEKPAKRATLLANLRPEVGDLVLKEARVRNQTEEGVISAALDAYFRGELSEQERYKQDYYRREIVHEFNLLYQRLYWYVTCISLLITSIALVMTTKEWAFRREFSLALVSLGVLLSILTIVGVEQAVKVIDGWRRKEVELRGDIDLVNVSPSQERWVPFLVKQKVRDKQTGELQDRIHTRSLWLSRWLAPLFIVALLVAGFYVYLAFP